MPRSKIIYGDEVLIDLTGDTVTADTLAEGVTAHDKAGNAITGTMAAAKPEQAKTATPSLSQQTINPDSGKVLSGVTVEPITSTLLTSLDPDFKPENIAKDANLFGLVGTHAGGGDGDIEAILTKTVIEYENESVKTLGIYAFASCYSLASVNFPACTSISSYVFAHCYSLASVNFPVCTSIGSYAFYACSSLTSVNFPVCTSIGSYAFYACSSLTSVNFPVCTSIGGSTFRSCYSLTSVNFPVCTSIGSYAFASCSSLTTIRLGASTVCTLGHSNAFSGTSVRTEQGYIYVPASLVNSYKTATNWTYYSSRIFAG